MAERTDMSLTKRAIFLLLNDELSKGLWEKEVNTTCYLISKSPQASQEVQTCSHIDLDHLRIFRCVAYVHIFSEYQSKHDPKLKGIFVGYAKGVGRFKLRDPIKNKMVTNKDVLFYEHLMLKKSVPTNVYLSS